MQRVQSSKVLHQKSVLARTTAIPCEILTVTDIPRNYIINVLDLQKDLQT